MAETLSAPPEDREHLGIEFFENAFGDRLERDFALVETPRGSEPVVVEAPPRPADASRGVDMPASTRLGRHNEVPTSLADLVRGDDHTDEPLRPTAPVMEIPPAAEPVPAERPAHVEADSAEPTPVETVPTPAGVAAAAVVMPPVPRGPIDYDSPLRLAFVSQERDADIQARHHAIQERQERTASGGPVKRFIKGIWNTYVGDFKQIGYRKQALERMHENGDVFIDQDRAEADRSLQATINRHTSDYEELIHKDRGEKRQDIESDGELATTIKDFIRQNIDGRLADEALREEVVRAVNAYGKQVDKTAFHDNAMIADNLLQIRDAVVGAREHEGGMERVLGELKISLGESRTGVNTEARYTRAERLAARISSTRVGALASPEAVLVVATVAGSALRLGGTRAAATVLTAVPGAAGALLSGVREGRLVTDERAQAARDTAQGRHAEAGSRRREELESTLYRMESAADLARELVETTGEDANLDDHDILRSALDAVANTRARIKASETRKIDLISYREGNVETEREALDLAYAYAKRAVRTRLENEATLDALGLPRDLEFDDLVERQADLTIETLQGGENGIDARDRAFAKLRRKRVVTAAAVGGVTGIVLGTAAQEAWAAFDPTRAGLVEQLWHAKTETVNGQIHHTLLDGLAHGDSHDVAVHHGASSHYESTRLGSDNADYRVSGDRTLINNGDGSFDLTADHGGASLDDLRYRDDGSLTGDSLDRLHDAGFSVHDGTETLTREVHHTGEASASELISHHKGEFTHVERQFWYDNNTPAPDYDRNELKLWWGGHANDGLDGNGGYRMSVAHMMEGGSFHDGMSADYRELAARGDLKLALSASANTQDHVILVDINRDGTINIPKGSTGAEFFSSHDGQARFDGRYAEVVQLRGHTSAGAEKIAPLATLVGNAHDSFRDRFTTHENYIHHQYTITSDGYNTHERVGDYTEMAPVIPVIGRRGIETVPPLAERGVPTAERIVTPYGYGYRSGERLSPAEQARRRQETSPRLRTNPEAVLNPGRELGWFARNLERTAGPEYAREVSESVASSPELRAIRPETAAVVTIPVKAAAEAENIYHTLSLYAQQDAESLAATQLLLHVNWFDDAPQDPSKAESIKKTIAEIDRARTDFPELRLATMTSVWSREKLTRGEYGRGIIGHVARKMYDAAMLSVQKGMADGSIPKDRDVLLIRNDADAQGIDRHYLSRMIASEREHRTTDIFSGAIRWDTARHSDLPGFAFVTNFRQIGNMNVFRKGLREWPETVGINVAVRMSTFAAVGGIGHDPEDTGAGSDDLNIGARISGARNDDYDNRNGRYDVSGRRRVGFGYLRRSGSDRKHKYDYQRLVSGAGIDSKGDRMEGPYLSDDKTVADTWEDFDKNGSKDRDEDLAGKTRRESLRDFAAVRGKVDKNIDAIINSWYKNEYGPAVDARVKARAYATLAFMMPTHFKAYSLKSTATGIQFHLTDRGAAWLKNRLERDGNGRFDPIGTRIRRQLYNEASGSRQPVSDVSRFVQ